VVLGGGDVATALEHLVARLSLEPGIHAVHWRAADDAGPLAVPAPATDPAGSDGDS
jgi:putative Mg2+ transporter-C (MgtC) family protein